MNILDLLDEKINNYYQKNKDYPTTIIMNMLTKEKIFTELKKEPIMIDSWADKQNNYRGIKIKVKTNTFIELE